MLNATQVEEDDDLEEGNEMQEQPTFLDALVQPEGQAAARQSQVLPGLNFIYSPRCMKCSGLFIGIIALLFSVVLLSVSLSTSLVHEGNDSSEDINPADQLNFNSKLPLWVLDSIDVNRIISNVQYLSSEELQGRQPGTPGEALAAQHAETIFKTAGLQPMGDNGTYIQKVPLVTTSITNTPTLSIASATGSLNLQYTLNFTLTTETNDSSVSLSSTPLVFVGYGIVAPNLSWDDYKSIDVKGKVVLVLFGSPSSFNATDAGYYGRTTKKYEAARKHGCAGIMFLNSAQDGQKWSQIVQQYQTVMMSLEKQSQQSPLSIRGWISEGASNQIASTSIQPTTFDKWIESANQTTFQPIDTQLTVSTTLSVTNTHIEGQSVIAGVIGAKHPNDVIVVMAHHDHLGTRTVNGKTEVYHGAVDNASGAALLLEMATVLGLYAKIASTPTFSEVGPIYPMDRTLMFVSVTAEEYGLLGSQYFIDHFDQQNKHIVSAVNFDIVNFLNVTRDVTLLGRTGAFVGPVCQCLGRGREDDSVARQIPPDPYALQE
ncbi:hypothetical protein SAMD00019534_126090, partial [Acytostelium subglobosum LB1]|uniref:hypothetical protein n=1 Tax=Acytostelium subglobosum LB1 TaxID=1410327 RepID=UPI000644E634